VNEKHQPLDSAATGEDDVLQDVLPVAPLKEDWGGDGTARMSLSGRRTAISQEYVPRQYQFFDTNPVPQDAGWQIPGTPANGLPGKRRLLTWNDCGASTSRVELPPQFKVPAGIFTADLEIFVLSGEIQLGEWRLRKHGYSFIPAGVKVGPWTVMGEDVAELLWMENGPVPLQYQQAERDRANARFSEFIPALDSKLLPWSKTDTVQFEVAKKKWLRKASNGGGVWLMAVLPHYDGIYAEIQCYNEEAYGLAGGIQIGTYPFVKDRFAYVPSFSTVPRHRTDDGGLFFVRIDRDLSKISTVLSYPY